MRNLAVLVFIVSFFAACTKEKLNNELVEGSWKWESTSFGERPSTSRPATDEIYILVFKSNKNLLMKRMAISSGMAPMKLKNKNPI